MQIFPLLITEMELEVVLDDMKVKCEVDPLALPKNDTNGEESLSLHIDRPRVKIECKDPTFDLDPVVQCDEKTPVSVSFSALKSETQDGNLMLQHVDGIKMNYEDSSNTFASEVKFDRAAPPVPFDTVKCEPEESCDVNIIKEEMLDVKTEDDDSSNRITPLHCHDTVQIEVEDCSTSAGQTNCLECAQDVPSTSSSHNIAFSNYGSSSSVCIPGGVEGQDVNSDSSQLTALQTFSVGNAFGVLLSRCYMGPPEPISVNTVEGSDRVEVSTCPSPREQESLVNHGRVISDSLECEHNTFSVTFDLSAHMSTVSRSMTPNSAENDNTTNDITVLLERPKKGRKRKNPDQNRGDRKRKCQLNQTYINQKGKVVKPKEFRDFQCNSKCNERVGIEDRKKEFEIFWNLESYEAKALYVASKVMVGSVRRKRTKGESRRHCTRIYTLAGVQVCKLCFTQTLRISGDRIDGYLKKTSKSETIQDNRGKSPAVNKLSEAKISDVVNHINRFSLYKSHYSTAQISTQFPSSHLTIPIMYDLYKSEHSEPVSLSTYKKIFYSKFSVR